MDGKVQKSLQREAALMAAGWLLHPCRKSFAIALAMALVRPFMRQRGIHYLGPTLRLNVYQQDPYR